MILCFRFFFGLFVRDFEDSFMKGIKVYYVRGFVGCIFGEVIVCCMFLLWIGDFLV